MYRPSRPNLPSFVPSAVIVVDLVRRAADLLDTSWCYTGHYASDDKGNRAPALPVAWPHTTPLVVPTRFSIVAALHAVCEAARVSPKVTLEVLALARSRLRPLCTEQEDKDFAWYDMLGGEGVKRFTKDEVIKAFRVPSLHC